MTKKAEETAVQTAEVKMAGPETAKVTEVPVKQKTHTQRPSCFCVYIGPNLKGLLQTGTIWRGTRDSALRTCAEAVKQFPEVQKLIVPGERLGEARGKIKTPGNALYQAYQAVKTSAGKA